MLARLTAVFCALVLVAGAITTAYQRGLRDAAGGPGDRGGVAEAAGEEASRDDVEEVLRLLDAEAVRAPDESRLIHGSSEGAIEGMIRALDDPYAQYFDVEEFTAFNRGLNDEFSGVGLYLQEEAPGDSDGPRALVVVEVIEGTPAAEAGVEAGERIVAVDGTSVRGQPLDAVVEQIKGEEGTDVVLGLAGETGGRREVTLTRAIFEVRNVASRLLDDGNGYVSLEQFSEQTGEDVRRAVEALVTDGAQGVILDLRNNPGGLLGEAVDVASLFVEDGPIVEVRERDADPRRYPAEGDALDDLPLVVLVNQYSASASEIVAGAIKDSGRGTIVGQPTFGKGTVQTIKTLDYGAGLKFTTAEYFLPDGGSIEGVGVEPDEVVRQPRDIAQGEDPQLSAARQTLESLIARAAG